ncbi:hypothetical protein [Halobacillus sp. Marseille-Q1614]|nr:hypothetical protein [Halobacillus sp. Marseille-Q1614]
MDCVVHREVRGELYEVKIDVTAGILAMDSIFYNPHVTIPQ